MRGTEDGAIVRLRGRGQTYGVIAGVVAGMLIAGLLVPLLWGDSGSTTATSGPQAIGGAARPVAGAAATTTTLAVSGQGPTTGPGASPTGGGSVAGGPAVTAAPTPGGAPLTASDKGVTPTSIKVGFVLLDLATAHTVGLAPPNYTPDSEKKSYQAFVDDLNKRGGVFGRQVQAFYATADPFKADTLQAACLTLTKDDGVFAVIALPGYTAGVLCVVKQNLTPMIFTGFAPQEFFQQAQGRLITDLQNIDRMMFDWIGDLDAQNQLRGHKLGVLADDDNTNGDKQGGDATVAALTQMQYSVVYRTHLSADLQTGASQIPLEVHKMQAAGVDYVLMPENFLYAVQFAQQADSQGWKPKYAGTDLQGITSDDLMKNMPASFDGALGTTAHRSIYEAREHYTEPDLDKSCRDIYDRNTGENHPYGETNPILYACSQVKLFESITNLAGPNLTRPGWIAAVQRRGSFAAPDMFGGSYGANKFDYADQVRTLKWSSGCKCWTIADQPHRVRY